jgi:glycine cleavage system transcriptional repressor
VSIEDSQMAILRGHFTMVLIVDMPDGADVDELRARLEDARRELALEAVTLSEVEELESRAVVPTHVVTVYGADHVGIVHAVGAALAERSINITDLSTRVLVGEGEQPLYVMLLEVAADDETGLERALDRVRADQGVECSVRPVETDAL